jgi:hypothetical protein
MGVDKAFIGTWVSDSDVYWNDPYAEYMVSLNIGGKLFHYAVEQDENNKWVIKFRIGES